MAKSAILVSDVTRSADFSYPFDKSLGVSSLWICTCFIFLAFAFIRDFAYFFDKSLDT